MINLPNNKVKNSYFTKIFQLNCGGRLLSIDKPIVMGILNITPDSFFDGGKYQNISDILARAQQIIDEGAEIIDIGAFSSRPGGQILSLKEEKERLYPALEQIREKFPEAILSVDTFRAEIAKEVVANFSVNMINDISAGEMDADMFETIAQLKVPYILMHMKGKPQTMQQNPEYENLMQEIMFYFAEKVDLLSQMGVSDLILDPGFGFGKTLNHNYELLAKLHEFKIFEKPLMVGLSRKSMIYKYLNTKPDNALNGTTSLNTIALLNGANILRVHDVKEAKETITLIDKLNQVDGFS